MASKDAIGIKRQQATERINASVTTLAERFGIAAEPIRSQGRGDPAWVHAVLLERLADVLEQVVTATGENSDGGRDHD